jgi:hypothetical protein
VVDRYYTGVTRYTTSTFLRMKIGDALKERKMAPHIYESREEAEGPERREAFAEFMTGASVSVLIRSAVGQSGIPHAFSSFCRAGFGECPTAMRPVPCCCRFASGR